MVKGNRLIAFHHNREWIEIKTYIFGSFLPINLNCHLTLPFHQDFPAAHLFLKLQDRPVKELTVRMNQCYAETHQLLVESIFHTNYKDNKHREMTIFSDFLCHPVEI